MRGFIFCTILFFSLNAFSKNGVRTVSANSCKVTRINLALGITTQIVFEQSPRVTLYADKKHFLIKTNKLTPRSLAIIPYFTPNEINLFRKPSGHLPSPQNLASILDKNFKTNLFVFFENNNQLMFELRFVEKEKADYILKVKQTFERTCVL
ncbi:MAG: DUF3802 family protein [Bdellovibrio sp.]|nr:MAG: DUF3802 family protein [Bdellovibrio sp.]